MARKCVASADSLSASAGFVATIAASNERKPKEQVIILPEAILSIPLCVVFTLTTEQKKSRCLLRVQ